MRYDLTSDDAFEVDPDTRACANDKTPEELRSSIEIVAEKMLDVSVIHIPDPEVMIQHFLITVDVFGLQLLVYVQGVPDFLACNFIILIVIC